MSQASIIGGTGALGRALALRLAAAGATVVIGSRRPAAAEETAAQIREAVPDADVHGADNATAAAEAPIAIVTVPFAAQATAIKDIRDGLLPGQVVVDATVPLAVAVAGRVTRLLGVPQGSAAEQARELLPADVHVVSALHTVSAANLARLETRLDEDVLIAGDAREAKRRLAQLVGAIDGLRCVDAGGLESARFIETLTPLLIGMNRRYRIHAGIRISGLGDEGWPDRPARADRSRAA